MAHMLEQLEKVQELVCKSIKGQEVVQYAGAIAEG
jgi:hypothetical protein